ncbi:MAG: DUF1508 domain-containing protein [Clostridia bacterium]|nr:DUF1508 domain-containing protein [Clostridia bacterium]
MVAINEFFKNLATKLKLPAFFKGNTFVFNNLFLALIVLILVIALILVIVLVPSKKKNKSGEESAPVSDDAEPEEEAEPEEAVAEEAVEEEPAEEAVAVEEEPAEEAPAEEAVEEAPAEEEVAVEEEPEAVVEEAVAEEEPEVIEVAEEEAPAEETVEEAPAEEEITAAAEEEPAEEAAIEEEPEAVAEEPAEEEVAVEEEPAEVAVEEESAEEAVEEAPVAEEQAQEEPVEEEKAEEPAEEAAPAPVKEEKKAAPKAKKSAKAEVAAAKEAPAPKPIKAKKPSDGKTVGKYEILERNGSFYFLLKANNGQLLLESPSYTSEQGAKNGIETFKKAVDGGIYTIDEEKNGSFRFVMRASTRSQMRYYGESYSTRQSAESSIQSVKNFAQNAIIKVVENTDQDAVAANDSATVFVPDPITEKSYKAGGKYEIIELNPNNFHFLLKANNGQLLLESPSYTSEQGAKNAIETFKKAVETGIYTIDEDKNGNFKFILRASTRSQIRYFGESYSTRQRAESSVNSVRSFAAKAVLKKSE